MTQQEIHQTKVWRINDSILVIAETIPLAIKIYETHYECNDVEKVELVKGKWDCDYALMVHKCEDEQ